MQSLDKTENKKQKLLKYKMSNKTIVTKFIKTYMLNFKNKKNLLCVQCLLSR